MLSLEQVVLKSLPRVPTDTLVLLWKKQSGTSDLLNRERAEGSSFKLLNWG